VNVAIVGRSFVADYYLATAILHPELTVFVKGCDQPAKDCHTHLLGVGQRMM
jgi:hypothetical protein